MNLAQVLAQSNQQPEQRVRAPRQEIESQEDSSSESEQEAVFTRRSGRARRPTKRYIDRDDGQDESYSES